MFAADVGGGRECANVRRLWTVSGYGMYSTTFEHESFSMVNADMVRKEEHFNASDVLWSFEKISNNFPRLSLPKTRTLVPRQAIDTPACQVQLRGPIKCRGRHLPLFQNLKTLDILNKLYSMGSAE